MVVVKRGEGLIVEAQPLGAAEEICRRLVDGVQVDNGALLLAANPAWAGAINTVLIKKGVRGNELRRAGDTSTTDTQEIPTLRTTSPATSPYGGCTDLRHVPSFTYWGTSSGA